MAGGEKIPVKLLVDKEKSRVVLAESYEDFVDILFSFLTLPMGTIIRLVGKESTLGCLGNLYESVENLDTQHLQTEACKTMLLRPLSAAAGRCEGLAINIDDTKKPRELYACQESDCCAKATSFYSSVRDARCGHCGEPMNSVKTWGKEDVAAGDGVFVKGGVSFMISDDLHVTPASTMQSLSLLDKLGITDGSALEERTLDLGPEEVSYLLERTLISSMPLTDLCFQESGVIDATAKLDKKEVIQPKVECETETDTECKRISTKLILDKSNKKVMYLEAGEELMNLLYSFLTFPLGSMIKLLNKNTTMGCIDNLWKSVEGLSIDEMKTEECRNMLLSPKLSPFFGYSNQLLRIDEASPRESSLRGGCHTCYWKNKNTAVTTAKCMHGLENSVLTELNPKRPDGGTDTGGGFAKGPGRFIVTDNMCVSPLTPISTIQTMSKLKVPFSRLVEREEIIEEKQALRLLRATLISQDALNDVFSPSNKQRRMDSQA